MVLLQNIQTKPFDVIRATRKVWLLGYYSRGRKGGLSMTQNQIAYFNALNQKQHNDETRQIQRDQNAETRRSNVARETETNRHNVITEGETARSNLANEYELWRSNNARERETKRSNRVNEAVKAESNYINRLNNEQRNAEQRRSNEAQEAIAAQNAATNERNSRTNVAGTSSQIDLNESKIKLDNQEFINKVIKNINDSTKTADWIFDTAGKFAGFF